MKKLSQPPVQVMRTSEGIRILLKKGMYAFTLDEVLEFAKGLVEVAGAEKEALKLKK